MGALVIVVSSLALLVAGKRLAAIRSSMSFPIGGHGAVAARAERVALETVAPERVR